jgi:hypothetical protein
LIRHLTPLIRFLTLSTRPLTDYSFALNYAVAELAPWPYHLTNILLHAGNVLLLYGIAWATLATPPLLRRYGAGRRPIAWTAAALFAVHPLASEAVGYISSRSEVLAAFWILLAFGSFIVAATTRRRTLRRVAAAVLFLAAGAGLGSRKSRQPLALAVRLALPAGRHWQRTRAGAGCSAVAAAVGGAHFAHPRYVHPSPMGDYAPPPVSFRPLHAGVCDASSASSRIRACSCCRSVRPSITTGRWRARRSPQRPAPRALLTGSLLAEVRVALSRSPPAVG